MCLHVMGCLEIVRNWAVAQVKLVHSFLYKTTLNGASMCFNPALSIEASMFYSCNKTKPFIFAYVLGRKN